MSEFSEPRPRSAWKQAALLVGIRVVVTLVLAVLANLALNEIQAHARGRDLWNDDLSHPIGVFLLGAFVIWLVILLIQAIVGNLAVMAALVTVLTAGIGVANYEKIHLRDEPLYPSDLGYATDPGFLKEMIGGKIIVLFAVGVVVTVLLCAAAFWLGRRFLPRLDRSRDRNVWRVMLTGRVVTGLVSVLALAYLTGFNDRGNEARKTYDAAGAYWRAWNQGVNYSINGFVGGFLYNMHVPAMQRPPRYSQAKMREIVAKYTALAALINKDRDPHALDDVNVVSVLSEAFSDPTRLKGLHLDRDPIPFTHHLMATTTSGQMLARNVGGGTANMEFEVLTGMSLSQFEPQLSTAYQMLVPNYQEFPSVVGYAQAHGHDAVAVHPFRPTMYRRDKVYPVLGFDRFIYDDTMTYRYHLPGTDNPYISDGSAFKEVLGQLDADPKPMLVNLVTMQNHLPYDGDYDDAPKITGITGTERDKFAQYVRGLTYTDVALAHFIHKLEASEERTVVVFYGDHLPAVTPHSLKRQNGRRVLHETPFFVWSNFSHVHDDQPTTSPTNFMPLAFQQAGAAIPPYYALIQKLHEEIPAMEGGTVINSANETTKRSELSPAAKEVLHDYRLVQYDLSVGKRYSQAALFYPPQTSPAEAAGH
jgi:phosphoglycerol transferase MdoB-like AlkP superfamily enzyme